jgi:hypothetical protein
MAFPCSFEESDTFMELPQGMSLDDFNCVSAKLAHLENGFPVVITAWKLTFEDLFEINRTGRIWLGVVGDSMQPVFITGVKPDFIAGK